MRANFLLSVALGLTSVSTAPLELAERLPPIVGGTAVPSASTYPFIAYLFTSEGYSCGGTILSPRAIITAAHCTFIPGGVQIPASHFTFRVGSLKHASGGTVVKVASYSRHPLYSGSTIDYDIVVMKLATSLTFGSTVSAASLVASGSDPAAGATTTTIGWGLTNENATALAESLREVDVGVVARATCNADYVPDGYSVTARMFCAAAAGKDSCSGDSGGPIFSKGTKILLGGVSWGEGCAQPGYPGVYANYGNAALNSFIVNAVAAAGT